MLISNDTVIIPELGAFVATYQSAKINEAEGKILPPTKSVSFNSKLKSDSSDLLENYVASSMEIENTEARKVISDFVEAAKAKFKMQGEITIDKVGILSGDENKKIVLKQFSDTTLLLDNYGMNSIPLPEKNEKATIAKVQMNTKTTKKSSVKSGKTMKRILIATPFIIVLVLFIVFYQKIYTWGDSIVENWFDKAVNEKTNDDTDIHSNENQTVELNDTLKIIEEDTTKITEKIEENINKDNKDDEENIDKDANKLNEQQIDNVTEINLGETYKNYYLIVGSFSTRVYAQKKVDELTAKGYEAEIITNEPGKFRVSIGGFNKVDDAISQYKKFVIKYDSKDIWMLRNK